jgi:hypothetical protein
LKEYENFARFLKNLKIFQNFGRIYEEYEDFGRILILFFFVILENILKKEYENFSKILKFEDFRRI